MSAAALEAEVDVCVAELAHERGEVGRRRVVPNGYHQSRTGTTVHRRDRGEGSAGERQARRRDHRRSQAVSSVISPLWCRKSPKIWWSSACAMAPRNWWPWPTAAGNRPSRGAGLLLRDCARRGMHAPVPAVGDGALGLWKALRKVFPTTRGGPPAPRLRSPDTWSARSRRPCIRTPGRSGAPGAGR